MEDQGVERDFKTKNIKFCAYLMLNSVNPIKVNKFSRGKGEFTYSLTEERWDLFKLNFASSEYIKYAHCIETVKDLCY